MSLQLELGQRPRVYLAGPDVFRQDVKDHFLRLSAACERMGLQAVAPADGSILDGPGPRRAQDIYLANTKLLRSVQGVIANLQNFRGLEPDAGTVFEVGYAAALKLPVVGYGLTSESYAQRVRSALRCERDEEGVLREHGTGMIVEDFDLQLNLMLSCSVELEATAVRAIERMAQVLAPAAAELEHRHDHIG